MLSSGEKEAFGAVERVLPSFLVFDDDDALGYGGRKWVLEMAIANLQRREDRGLPICHALCLAALLLQSQCIRILEPGPSCADGEE